MAVPPTNRRFSPIQLLSCMGLGVHHEWKYKLSIYESHSLKYFSTGAVTVTGVNKTWINSKIDINLYTRKRTPVPDASEVSSLLEGVEGGKRWNVKPPDNDEGVNYIIRKPMRIGTLYVHSVALRTFHRVTGVWRLWPHIPDYVALIYKLRSGPDYFRLTVLFSVPHSVYLLLFFFFSLSPYSRVGVFFSLSFGIRSKTLIILSEAFIVCIPRIVVVVLVFVTNDLGSIYERSCVYYNLSHNVE